MSIQPGNQSSLTYGQVLKAAFDDTKYQFQTINAAQLVPEVYNEILISYTGEDVTGVIYKQNSITVATLTLTYSSGKLTGVVRS